MSYHPVFLYVYYIGNKTTFRKLSSSQVQLIVGWSRVRVGIFLPVQVHNNIARLLQLSLQPINFRTCQHFLLACLHAMFIHPKGIHLNKFFYMREIEIEIEIEIEQ